MLAIPQILILAAGASKRMRGADKLLEVIDGVAQIRRIADMALDTGADVYVALSPDHPLRAAALRNLPLKVLQIADAAQGMAASIRTANAAIPAGPIMLLLADLPDITTADLQQMIAAYSDQTSILRGTAADGTPGHPVILPDWLRPELATLIGDKGAHAVLQRHATGVRHIALPANHAITDLDTPEDWAAWRAQMGRTVG